ncbi:hypothetical protein C7S14_4744 [Burkholderia cepacia]|nr:hypothetical protein C7S14_4744 [Burkholderia cepacia]
MPSQAAEQRMNPRRPASGICDACAFVLALFPFFVMYFNSVARPARMRARRLPSRRTDSAFVFSSPERLGY